MSEKNPSSSSASASGIDTLPPKPSSAASAPNRKWIWLAGGVVLILGGGGSALLVSAQSAGNSSWGPSALVRRGPLAVSITESGEIEAERRTVISNELRWPVVIKQVVPEGTVVQEDQVIIEFECKELNDAIAQQKITVTATQNAYTRASEDYRLKKKEMALKLRKAQQAVKDAEDDQKRYVEGDWPIQLWEKESQINVLFRQLTLAKNTLEFKELANAMPELKRPYSDRDMEAARLEVAELENRHEKAVRELKMLKKYNGPRERLRLAFAVEETGLALDRTTVELETQLLSAKAEAEAKKATLDMQTDKLNEQLEDDRKLVVKADRGGLVVYDTGRRRWGPSDVTVAVGEKISPRQQLMIIPDMSTLQIRTKVYEAMYEQVSAGLDGYIRLDAKPDVVLRGKVKKVAPLPDKTTWWEPNVKAFVVTVGLDEQIAGLKPGMTAKVELILAHLDDVLTVPVAAVFTEQKERFCYRLTNGEVERIGIKLGRMNEKEVEVVEGLKAGDEVLLVPPSEEAPKAAPMMPGQNAEETST